VSELDIVVGVEQDLEWFDVHIRLLSQFHVWISGGGLLRLL